MLTELATHFDSWLRAVRSFALVTKTFSSFFINPPNTMKLLFSVAIRCINCLAICFVVVRTLEIDNRISRRFWRNRNRLKCKILRWALFVVSRLLIGDLVSNIFAVDEIENSTCVRLLTSSLLGREIFDARIVQIVVMDALVYFSICFLFWLLLRCVDLLPEPFVTYVDQFILKNLYRGYFREFAEKKLFDIPRLRLGINMIPHMHDAALDIATFIRVWSEARGNHGLFHPPNVPQLDWTRIEILDFDSCWPNCSFIHAVLTFLCPTCDRSNRFYVLREYLYPRRTEAIASWWFDKRFFFFIFHQVYTVRFRSCAQSGRLLFIRTENAQQLPVFLYIFDIRRVEVVQLSCFDIFPDTWAIKYILRDPAPWKPEMERRSSIFLRVVYFTRIPEIVFGHCLVEVPIDNSGRRPSILSSEEFVVPPTPLQFQIRSQCVQFRGSRNVYGFCFEPAHHPLGRYQVIYDTRHRLFQLIIGQEDLLENGRPYQMFKHRWHWKFRGYGPVERYLRWMPHVLNETEAIDIYGDDQMWRICFQPPSLKYLALMAFSAAYHKNVRDFDAQKWTELSGIRLDDPYPSLSELEVIKFSNQ